MIISFLLIAVPLVFLFITPLLMVLSGTVDIGRDRHGVRWDSAGIAPDPARTPEAIVQVYAARVFDWRGIFGVHTWIATKPAKAPYFTIHQVIDWQLSHGLPAVSSKPGIPDRYFGGNPPEIVAELRGPRAAKAIDKIVNAVQTYPHALSYKIWPGPNSNTFTAHVARHVPELELNLPVTAIGKDYPTSDTFVERAPSGTGYQFTIYGLAGLLVAKKEGIELNLFGLSFGIDLLVPALKLPFIGRLRFNSNPNGGPPSSKGASSHLSGCRGRDR